MDTDHLKQRAVLLYHEGQKYHQIGDLGRAIRLYTESIATFPTAECYTFRGGIYSFQGKYDKAIVECKKAIEIDPGLGNPYNDIGSYLIAMGKMDEAEDWLIKAKAAARYDLRHCPYMNLGRLYAARGQLVRAIEEFEEALKIFPAEPNCSTILQYMRKLVN